MRKALDQFYRLCQRLLVPELENSQYEFVRVLEDALRGRQSWLDLGCGRRLLPDWMPSELEDRLRKNAPRTIGTDLDLASLRDNVTLSLRVQASAEALPFPASAFDIVSANMVMEHVAEPAEVLGELRRVLRPGGVFIFHTPNRFYWAMRLGRFAPQWLKATLAALLEGRAEEDVFPTHYRLNDVDEISRVAVSAGFQVERLTAISSSPVLTPLGPFVIPELLWTRLLRRPSLAARRSNFIAVLRAS